VGFPGSAKISMNGLYFGSNIDGGTYPAQIWGDYMKKVVSKGCGSWRKPKEPFSSQPFKGSFATEGADDEDGTSTDPGTGTGTDPAQPPADTQPSAPEANNGGNNDDAAFDPGAYETAPQGPPESGGTQAPPGDG
jgi:penicillin-binding protein 1A